MIGQPEGMRRKTAEPPPPEPRIFKSADEVDRGIEKLQRRVNELEGLDVPAAMRADNGAVDVAQSNVRAAVREVFGPNSPEFQEHEYLEIWAGPLHFGMQPQELLQGYERGRARVIGIVNGLIARLQERRAELGSVGVQAPTTYFDRLNLHPRIIDVSRDLFMDGHPWEAVFAAAKALVNYVQERSGRHDLDGAPLMRTVFSRNAPMLAFNDLGDPTDLDEQEGMMHLFEGAVLAIRNPGGHTFPEGPEQRAVGYIQLLSLLAYRVQEARRVKPS